MSFVAVAASARVDPSSSDASTRVVAAQACHSHLRGKPVKRRKCILAARGSSATRARRSYCPRQRIRGGPPLLEISNRLPRLFELWLQLSCELISVSAKLVEF